MTVVIGAKTVGFAAGMAAAVLAIKAVGQAMAASIKAAGEQEAAFANLEARIGTDAANAFSKFATQLQKTTAIGDEASIAAAAVASSFGLTGVELQKAVAAASDMAAVYGTDLKSAIRLVGQGLSGQVSMLGRYVPALKGAKFEALGFDGVLKELNNSFGGAALAAADTYLGSVKGLQGAYGDLQEQVGGGFTPVLKELNNIITTQIFNINESEEGWKEWRDAVKDAALMTIDVAQVVLDVGKRVVALATVFSKAGSLIGRTWAIMAAGLAQGVLLAFSNIVTGLSKLIPGMAEFAEKMEQEAAAAVDLTNEKIEDLVGTAGELADAFKVLTGKSGSLVLDNMRLAIEGIDTAAKSAKKSVGGLGEALTGSGEAAAESVTDFSKYLSALFNQGESIIATQEAAEKAAEAQKKFQASIVDTTSSMIFQVAAGQTTVKQLIGQLAALAAAYAAKWAFQKYPFPASLVIAGIAAASAGGLVKALDSFHAGGTVQADDGIQLPGMAPNERLVSALVGETFIPPGQSGGGTNITFTSVLPMTESEARRVMERTVVKTIKKLIANGYA